MNGQLGEENIGVSNMSMAIEVKSMPLKMRWQTLVQAFNNEQNANTKNINKGRQKYFLNAPFDDIYLTQREYETVIELLKGASIKTIAQDKHISPRTVEEYVKSVREKLGFVRKQEMVRMLHACNYLSELQAIKPVCHCH